LVFCLASVPLRVLLSLPTRRSSDLDRALLDSGANATFTVNAASMTGFEEISTVNGFNDNLVVAYDYGLTGTSDNYHMLIALDGRSEEHTSELQSREKLVCRLLLEKK